MRDGGGEDGKAEKLHFERGKLNQLCNGGLEADGQTEAAVSGQGDYCCACVRVPESLFVRTRLCRLGHIFTL